MPELMQTVRTYSQKDTIFDIMKSYSEVRNRNYVVKWSPKALPILSIEDARKRLERYVLTKDVRPFTIDSGSDQLNFLRSEALQTKILQMQLVPMKDLVWLQHLQ